MLLAHYQATRQLTESLCEPLHIEDYIPQAADFVSPPKWHLAHVTWFFETMVLNQYVEGYTPYNSDFHFLFNSYYQSMGERAARSQRGLMTRPTVKEVFAYRQYVDKHMHQLLSTPIDQAITSLITLGINHEQQHQELLLTDLKYTLSFNPTHPIYLDTANLVNDTNNDSGWVDIPAGRYDIGHDNEQFCFDNELGRHSVYLHDYSLSKSLVTNGEYLEFIEDGGYQQFHHWLDEGWSWVCNNHVSHPLYWKKIDGCWFYYTLAGLQPVNKASLLCHISFYEANAFANWKQQRLPTEFEWEVASPQLDWGKRWEWTASAYQAYPNFCISEGAVGEYNGKFMINQMVLRGASVATPKGHERHTYRNFFHPHFQWQFSGIRLAK